MILHLRIIEASDIPPMDSDKSDPYCVIQLIPQSDYKEKTEVVYNSLSPRWNQEFHIPISNVQISSLYLSIYDKDEHKDDIISTLILPIGTMQIGMVIDQWYPMIPTEQVNKGGMLHIVTQLSPSNAQPFMHLPQNYQGCVPPGSYQSTQLTSPMQGQYTPQQSSYSQQQAPYSQPQYIQQQQYVQQQYGQQQQFQQYAQPQQQYAPQQYAQQQQFYAGQPLNPNPSQPYPPPQGQYYPNQPPYSQPMQGAPYSPYGDPYNTPPPPRPPGMNDENYKKLKKAQKKMLKKLAKGDIKGCFKKGMECFLKI